MTFLAHDIPDDLFDSANRRFHQFERQVLGRNGQAYGSQTPPRPTPAPAAPPPASPKSVQDIFFEANIPFRFAQGYRIPEPNWPVFYYEGYLPAGAPRPDLHTARTGRRVLLLTGSDEEHVGFDDQIRYYFSDLEQNLYLLRADSTGVSGLASHPV